MKNNPSTIQLYRQTENYSFVVTGVVEMKSPIDGEILQKAANTAIKRYPYFSKKISLSEDGKDYVFIDNDLPICVIAGEKPVVLCSKETNYHLHCLCYEKNTIYFHVSHAWFDGTSLTDWIKTVLYYYLCSVTGKTLDSTNIRILGEEITPEEYTDPYKSYSDEMMKKYKAQGYELDDFSNDVESVSMEDYAEVHNQQTAYFFSVKADEFIKIARINDGSPATFISSLLAKILHEINPEEQKDVVGNIIANQRPVFKNDKSFHPTIGGVLVNYSNKTRGKSLDFLSTISRGKIILAQEEENFFNSTMGVIDFNTRVLMLEDNEQRFDYFKKVRVHQEKIATYMVSYTGNLPLGSLREHIENFSLLVNPDISKLLLEINSLGDKLCFLFNQTFADDYAVKGVMDFLKSRGVNINDYKTINAYYPMMYLPDEKHC